MSLSGSFTIRIKNPTYEEYDAIQYVCKMRLSVQAELQEKFLLAGTIKNMTINVEAVNPFYYIDEEDSASLEEI